MPMIKLRAGYIQKILTIIWFIIFRSLFESTIDESIQLILPGYESWSHILR